MDEELKKHKRRLDVIKTSIQGMVLRLQELNKAKGPGTHQPSKLMAMF